MKTEKNKGFTLAELITVIVIITILIGVLMPALSQVKKIALETKQKSQIASIEVGINVYKNDFGSYPPSHGGNMDVYSGGSVVGFSYCGAQTLGEAMFGQDLFGYNPDSNYTNEGRDNPGITTRYYIYSSMSSVPDFNDRKGPYLDRTNIDVFDPCTIFQSDSVYTANHVVSDRVAICDVFTAITKTLTMNSVTKTYKIGTPVLYFQANTSAVYTESIAPISNPLPANFAMNIYNWGDNYWLLRLGKVSDGSEHKLYPKTSGPPSAYLSGQIFYDYIRDTMIPKMSTDPGNCGTPLRKDSFLLISAGYDGIFGTKDDICNFTPNLQ